MHTTESTYSTITEDEEESYEKWLQQRDIAYLHSIKLNLIKTHPIIQVMYKRLVPSVVTETNFWNHYFFHMEKGMPLIRTLLIALAAGIPLNGAIVWSLQRGIYRQSVYEAMRFGE